MIIQNIFDDCEHLVGIKMIDNYIVVETNLPNNWVIPEHDTISYNKEKNKDNHNMMNYIFYSEKGVVMIDDIIDFIKYEVIKQNQEREEKQKLLNMKIDELKELFEKSSLKDLQLANPIETIISKDKKNKQPKEKTEENVTTE